MPKNIRFNKKSIKNKIKKPGIDQKTNRQEIKFISSDKNHCTKDSKSYNFSIKYSISNFEVTIKLITNDEKLKFLYAS
jgi:hypothetical protein